MGGSLRTVRIGVVVALCTTAGSARAQDCAAVTSSFDFASGLQGWTLDVRLDNGTTAYSSYTVSNSGGVALLSGDGSEVVAGMRQAFPVVGDTFRVTWDWRATSDTTGSTVTNSRWRLDDASGVTITSGGMVAGGITDSGWQTETVDLSSYVVGRSSVRFVLTMRDAWGVNYHQTNRWDDVVVETGITPMPTWYLDSDGDGYGAGAGVDACTAPTAAYVLATGDCDDAAGWRHPGAAERADLVDDDCDGVAAPQHQISDHAGTLLFEDLWPCAGDRDFNDLVLSFDAHAEERYTGTIAFSAVLEPRAVGADLHSGLRWGLPAGVAVQSATIRLGDPATGTWGAAAAIPESGGVLTLTPDVRAWCGGASGFVNTEGDAARCDAALVEVVFASPVVLPNAWPFDLHLYQEEQPGWAVRRPQYGALAGALGGTCDSDPASPYVATGPVAGLPWVLLLPDAIDAHPRERVRIEVAWPDILDFVTDEEVVFWQPAAPDPLYLYSQGGLGTPGALDLDALDDDGDGACEGWSPAGGAAECVLGATPGDCDDTDPLGCP